MFSYRFPEFGVQSIVSLTFTPEGQGTRMGFLQTGFPNEEHFTGHKGGWTSTLSILEDLILKLNGIDWTTPNADEAVETMLAVAAVSNDEAWAVGAMGLVVHIKGNLVERHVIPGGAWLRAVVANAPHDIWIAGDDGTLLHGDGRAFHPVQHPLGARAAFSGLAVARSVVWATSPSGILRIVNSGTTAPM